MYFTKIPYFYFENISSTKPENLKEIDEFLALS